MQFIKYIIILFSMTSLYSHHNGAGLDTTLFNVRFLGANAKNNSGFPPSYIILSAEYNRGAIGNKNLLHSTFFGESIFKEGLFTLNINSSYIYYEQKDRDDAARFGKTYIGGKIFPFYKTQFENNYFFFVETRLGLPTGADNTKFIESDYYTGIGNLAYGKLWSKVSIVGRIGGEIPLSKYKSTDQSQDGIPYYLRTNSSSSTDEIQLKKSTNFSAFLTYSFFDNFSIFAGYLYRTPFYGVQKERSTGDKVPLIFKEISFGFNYRFKEDYLLTISYKNPLYRGRDFRPYESSIFVGISISL